MMMPQGTKIAGMKTVADWQKLKATLIVGGDAAPWKNAFEDFFHERLRTRYFDPIEKLSQMTCKNGEGFSIVTIHCSLIEFLSSTFEGKNYRYRSKDDPLLGEFEYSKSKDMFVRFLSQYPPFRDMFQNKAAAQDFYVNVRCKLLHEAQTKGGWRIRVDPSAVQAIDTQAKIVYRNKMQEAFDLFTQWYGEKLPENDELQRAFIRKFDSLCED
ncbi:MAG: hypothetical protein P8Y67_13045 [Alphaproteobacteria bacterium]